MTHGRRKKNRCSFNNVPHYRTHSLKVKAINTNGGDRPNCRTSNVSKEYLNQSSTKSQTIRATWRSHMVWWPSRGGASKGGSRHRVHRINLFSESGPRPESVSDIRSPRVRSPR